MSGFFSNGHYTTFIIDGLKNRQSWTKTVGLTAPGSGQPHVCPASNFFGFFVGCCLLDKFSFTAMFVCFRTYGRASRQLRVATNCVPFDPDIIPRFDEWALVSRPFLHTYWTCCVRITLFMDYIAVYA